MSRDYTRRFNKRASVYAKYRPAYPVQILEVLKTEIRFTPKDSVADIGSGTGLLSRLFLENGNTVYGVEPNEEMRSEAEQSLVSFPNFHSINGTAENTTLEEGNIDLIAVGQALHWFNHAIATKEFSRILKTTGHLCVVYNDRDEKDQFMQSYDRLVKKHARDRPPVPELGDHLPKFFQNGIFKQFTLTNTQPLDKEGLLGRITSASYIPNIDEKERYGSLLKDVSKLFTEWQEKGRVRMLYNTSVFLGSVRR